ncbi:MAG: CBS domain-containing protein [Prolixibacteraceae bacterium]|jgi:TalC/MipB family fructose-6-phosphate aldolase|nr:CBS domain-containing protein [Prolixibacteraceae bacterium]
MEFFLDSANMAEIEEALKLGIIDGVTTTPTFMHKNGITDIDGAIVKLSQMVPILMIEALGETAEEIVAEAERLLALGLDINKTVFKIPVNLEGIKACKKLRNKGFLVNLHLVYNIQQAYLALVAGATYVCILVGRMQDQGHDALGLVKQVIDVIKEHKYNTKVMFSSVRYPEHIKDALLLGAHNITIPWSIMKKLGDNHLTKLGTDQFFQHTRLMTIQVRSVISDVNPVVDVNCKVLDALLKMTDSGMGAVSVVSKEGNLAGIFTDGDLRRQMRKLGDHILTATVGECMTANAISIDAEAMLQKATDIFNANQVDNIIVTEKGKPIGMLDIQDLVKLNLLS